MGEVTPSRQPLSSTRPVARRKGRLIAACVVLSLGAAVAVAITLRYGRHAPNIVGEWKSWRSNILIARDGDGYQMVITNPNGFLGGTYAGKPHRDVITVSGPLSALCGRMQYEREDDKLDFCGEEFERIRR